MNSALLRTLLVYGIVLPVAVVVGWMLSTPLHLESLSVVGFVLFILLLPTILAHHYAILIFSWNALLNAFFLPGKPYFWTLMVTINIAMMVMYRVLQRRPLFIHVPSLTFTTVLLFLVVLVTAHLRGGIGVRTFGSAVYGGRFYFFVFMALLGYFALASRGIEWKNVNRYTGLYFLSGLTGAAGHIIYYFPALYILYEVFPVNTAISQYLSENFAAMTRLGGMALAGCAAIYYLMARYGIRGILSKPLVTFLAITFAALSMLGGFRSTLLILVTIGAMLFVLEGLHRTKWALIVLLVGGLSLSVALPFANKLPRAAQRVLSVIPGANINAHVRADAHASLDWRFRMWAAVMPDLPKYLWLGKGYALNPTDMFLTSQAIRRGYAPDFAASMTVGDYHNGPLSVYVPFGLPGSIAFLLFLGALGRALYLNNKNGASQVQTLNRFLFAFFIAKAIFFFSFFGSFHSDLATFTGLAGLSVALNRGVCRYPEQQRATAKTAIAEPPIGLSPTPA